MTPLFVLQLACCIVTAMLAIHLFMASVQVRWKVGRYEVSRWLLCVSMLLFSTHYLLQMIHGLRAQGPDVGAVFNILFYTPVAFIITLSIINIENMGRSMLSYCYRSGVAYAFIVLAFAYGVFRSHSLHIGSMLYVMLALFVASMAYFISVTHHATALRKRRLLETSGSDLIPYVRYSKASIFLLYLAAAFLPITILFNTLLYIIGPLMLLAVIFFVHTFISLGYYITPKEEILGGQNKSEDEFLALEDETTEEWKASAEPNVLTNEKVVEIECALKKWCEEDRYKDSGASIYSLAARLGYKKAELTAYFNQSGHTNFRTWLSDIRFNEAVRMMQTCPDYSIDAISTECGFSSHTWIYRIFKQKTGMSPSQWRKKNCSSAK